VANPFVHVELYTHDLKASKKFYSSLFGWELDDVTMPDGMNYTMIKAGEGTGGGMMTAPDPGIPPHWLAYVAVDDLAASTKRAKELGATMIMENNPVPGYGKFTIFKDPMGALIAMWEPAEKS
jgi:predicted enzyme related to lactoylglutathione lyase